MARKSERSWGGEYLHCEMKKENELSNQSHEANKGDEIPISLPIQVRWRVGQAEDWDKNQLR